MAAVSAVRTGGSSDTVEEFKVHYSDSDGTAAGPSNGNATQQGTYVFQHRVPSGLRCVFQDMITLDGL